jgi:hypothetical protein
MERLEREKGDVITKATTTTTIMITRMNGAPNE